MEENNRKQFKVTDDVMAKLEQRFLNWFLDSVMLVLLFLLLITIVTAVAYSYGKKELPAYLMINPIGQFTFITIIRLIYYIAMETWLGRSVGKFVSQTIVVNENGERVGHEVILIRTLCRLIPFYEFSFFGIPTRGWHDSISKTYVVDKKRLEEKKAQFYAIK
ncbi:RDD family protein [Flavobacterium wongokense]|uniref:RDD family protein n=1 Tax=Flavobacterium wongokense TaxID=2910674 RepID=UPI001F470B94|nr:RDD family protein [Flavobacterium sp. WG47]MCF6131763.1 RDD family protein [Flavobacterium sp. WG47]